MSSSFQIGSKPLLTQESEKKGIGSLLLGILLLPFVAGWWLFRALLGIWVLLLGIALIALALHAVGILGSESAKPVADSRSCPGYDFVRSLKIEGQINSFAPIKPEKGWQCEYSLDNEDASVRLSAREGKSKPKSRAIPQRPTTPPTERCARTALPSIET
jgi:hypothetical protein